MRKSVLVFPVLMTLIMAGCSSIEVTARDGIAASKGFLDSQAAVHSECQADPTIKVCALIIKGNATKHVAIDALEEYCTSPAFEDGTGPCTPPTDKTQKDQLQAKLNGALTSLNQTISDIKALK